MKYIGVDLLLLLIFLYHLLGFTRIAVVEVVCKFVGCAKNRKELIENVCVLVEMQGPKNDRCE
jgi:hypothetical protein